MRTAAPLRSREHEFRLASRIAVRPGARRVSRNHASHQDLVVPSDASRRARAPRHAGRLRRSGAHRRRLPIQTGHRAFPCWCSLSSGRRQARSSLLRPHRSHSQQPSTLFASSVTRFPRDDRRERPLHPAIAAASKSTPSRSEDPRRLPKPPAALNGRWESVA
jgi:hypothetical protein